MTKTIPIIQADHVKPGDVVTYMAASDRDTSTGTAYVHDETQQLLVNGSTQWRNGFYHAERPEPSELELAGVEAVLHYFGRPEGIEPGTFVAMLLDTMSHADRTNRARLVQAFPEYGIPFVVAKDERGGTDRLAEIARRA